MAKKEGQIKQLAVRIPESLHYWLKVHATIEGKTLSDTVEQILTEYREKIEKRDK